MKRSVGIVFVFVAACGVQLTNQAAADTTMDPRIVFPGPIQELENRYGAVNETDPCKDLTFCTIKPKDYPQERYNKMFKGKITEPIYQPTPSLDENSMNEVDNRQGDPSYSNNCETKVSFTKFFRVRTETGQWRNVIQAKDENFLQMARTETCKAPQTPCFTDFKAPSNVNAKCKQGYNKWEFLVDDEKGGTERITVDLPVCCSCHHTKV